MNMTLYIYVSQYKWVGLVWLRMTLCGDVFDEISSKGGGNHGDGNLRILYLLTLDY